MKIWVALSKIKGERKPKILGAFHTLKEARIVLDIAVFANFMGDRSFSVKKFESLGGKKK